MEIQFPPAHTTDQPMLQEENTEEFEVDTQALSTSGQGIRDHLKT